MEYRSRDQMLGSPRQRPGLLAVLFRALRRQPLSRKQKLTLWAEALERLGEQRLRTLFEVEYAPEPDRMRIRADNSPVSVAAALPRLQQAGLAGDTVGDAMRFFELAEWQLHAMLCYCLYGETMAASSAAERVRAAAERAV
jgi:hypothetical protein